MDAKRYAIFRPNISDVQFITCFKILCVRQTSKNPKFTFWRFPMSFIYTSHHVKSYAYLDIFYKGIIFTYINM